MNYELAREDDLDTVFEIVQETIKMVYPRYYPAEVVDFFSELHSREAIETDMRNGHVGVLVMDGMIVGTGCFVDNHITRVYVSPIHQHKGYGTYIINEIEAKIGKEHSLVQLDASLPAASLYEKLGYRTIKHEKYPVKNNVILAYEIMEKKL